MLTFHVVRKNKYIVVKQQSENSSNTQKRTERSEALRSCFSLFCFALFLKDIHGNGFNFKSCYYSPFSDVYFIYIYNLTIETWSKIAAKLHGTCVRVCAHRVHTHCRWFTNRDRSWNIYNRCFHNYLLNSINLCVVIGLCTLYWTHF